jgi:uncharacterized membrane protein (DUF485 family)
MRLKAGAASAAVRTDRPIAALILRKPRGPIAGIVSVASVSRQPRLVLRQSGVSPGAEHARMTPPESIPRSGDSMEDDLVRRIATHPKYLELKARRTGFGWWLTLAMMAVYYGFILLVAFNKPFLSQRLGDGVMTMGIPIGFGVIVFTVVITAFYVQRANRQFDDLADAIAKGVLR